VPDKSLAAINAGVAGLSKELVPITALKVRLCNYGPMRQLASSALGQSIGAARLATEANGFRQFSPPRFLGCHEMDVTLLIFASESQQVSIETYGCGGVNVATNGVLTVRPTTTWLN